MEYGNQDYSSINYSIQIRLNNYRSNDEEIVEESCMRTENGRIVEEFFRIYEVDMVLGEKLWYTNRDERVARWCRLVRVATMKELKEVIGDGFMGKEVDDKLIEEVNRYSGSYPREKESDVLELVDQFGGMLLDRPERIAFKVDEALVLLEYRNLKDKYNRYFKTR